MCVCDMTYRIARNSRKLDEVEQFAKKTFVDCRSYPTHAHIRTKFHGLNFRGRRLCSEIRKRFHPRKFPAILYTQLWLCLPGGVSQPPEFELFPQSPFNVLFTDQMVLHTELSTTTERITLFWQHGDTIHSNFIFEDPFCIKAVEVSFGNFN